MWAIYMKKSTGGDNIKDGYKMYLVSLSWTRKVQRLKF